MKAKEFHISGRIIDQTGQGIECLRVEAWDKDLFFDDFLGKATTDEQGCFTIEFDESCYQELCFDRKPDIFFKVYKDKTLVKSTEDSVLWNVISWDREIIIRVEGEWPVKFIRFDINAFKVKTNEGSELDKVNENYIDYKLNNHLKKEILKYFSVGSSELKKAISELIIDYTKAGDFDLRSFVEGEILPQLKAKPDLKEELDKIIIKFSGKTKTRDLLGLNIPLKHNPIFKEEIRAAKVFELSMIAGLEEPDANSLIEQGADLEFAVDETWSKLVEDGIIPESKLNDLKLTFELSKLTGENFELIKLLKTEALSQLGEEIINSTKDLVVLEKSDWLDILQENQIEPPDNVVHEEYSETLAYNIAQSYTSDILFHHLAVKDKTAQISLVEEIQPLLANNDMIFTSKGIAELNWEGIDPNSQQSIEDALQQLNSLANTYRYLGIADILNNHELGIDEKKVAVQQEVDKLKTFYTSNPNLDMHNADFIEEIDYSNSASVELVPITWTGIEANDKPKVRKQLMAYQRVMGISSDNDTTTAMLANGYHSAYAITAATEERFCLESGLSNQTAKVIYNKARQAELQVAHGVQMAQDLARGLFDDLQVGNIGTDLVNDIKKIDGYEELFGSQNYCDCTHCKSIFGPAAYFVDLMYFIEKKVSDITFQNRRNHPLYLKNRRPDLWSLQLTCENTNTLIPYLDIIIEILETYIAEVTDSDAYQVLNDADNSFNQPFNLPLTELRTYLGHFDLNLATIFRTFKKDNEDIARELLNISKEEFEIITEQDTANIENRYGNPPSTDEMDVQYFLKYTGITRGELDLLIKFKYINVDLNSIDNISISKEQDPDEIQDYIEKVKNLSKSRLDRIHRLIRLWRKLPWTLEELYLVFSSLINANYANTLNGDAVKYIATLRTIQTRLHVSAEELCGLWYLIPNTSVEEGKTSLYERLFESKESLTGTPWLLAGLGISETDLLLLIEALGINIDENQSLNREQVSLLYHYTKLADGLHISIEDLLYVSCLQFPDADMPISHIDHIRELIDFHDWFKTTPLSIAELWFILKGEESNQVRYQISEKQILSLIKTIDDNKALFFKDTVLTALEGISKDDSEKIINRLKDDGLLFWADDSGLFKLTNQYRLDQELAEILEDLDISDEAKGKETQIRDLLNSYHPRAVLPPYLSELLGINQEIFATLMPFVNVNLGDSEFITALTFPIAEDYQDNILILVSLVQQLEQFRMLFDKLKLIDSLQFVLDNPDVFKISDLNNLDVENIKFIADYSSLLALKEDSEETLNQVLINYAAAIEFSQEDIKLLSIILDNAEDLISSVKDSLILNDAFTKNPIEVVLNIIECLNICTTLGINGQSLNLLGTTDFDGLPKARNTVFGAFRAKYNNEEEWDIIVEPFENKIRALKRDALSDYILSSQLNFEGKNDLYHYFLIDTEMEGCAKISRVKVAILSLQLYIQRCLTNLEQSESEEDSVKVLPSQIPADEWEWRKNYRVWEANRKVFLYPENWIEPELRDNKTPIFKELEEDLLQQEVTLEAAENTYKTYMTRFMEVANLKISGSYYHAEEKTLHLFGRTVDDPSLYYYRKYIDNTEWTPWQKVDLTINAEKVSPIVYQCKLYVFWIETLTKQKNKIVNGNSTFMGYTHKVTLKYSFLDLNGKWKIPTAIILKDIDDELANEDDYISIYPYPGYEVKIPKLDAFIPEHDKEQKIHFEPFDDYTLRDYEWERIYPFIYDDYLLFYYCAGNLNDEKDGYIWDYYDYMNTINRYEKRIEKQGADIWRDEDLFLADSLDTYIVEENHDGIFEGNYFLHKSPQQYWSYLSQHYHIATKMSTYEREGGERLSNAYIIEHCIGSTFKKPNISVINGSYSDYILKIAEEYLLLSKIKDSNSANYIKHTCERLGTTTADRIIKILYNSNGLESFLSLKTQIDEKEEGSPFAHLWGSYFIRNHKHIDFDGASGNYYRELYFHIPFLIANHLNANQKFAEAQKWYHYIFNPTACEDPESDKPSDRNWQYIMFRDLDVPKLKEILTDDEAIEKYKKNPFNPHAIARIRISAYQKSIVMKYIDNLLDWGDYLFSQDTFESINEAMILYIMAADILGERPVKLGKCETVPEGQITYDSVASSIEEGSEFLITMENYVMNAYSFGRYQANAAFITNNAFTKNAASKSNVAITKTTKQVMHYRDVTIARREAQAQVVAELAQDYSPGYSFGDSFVHQSNTLVFCAPPNEILLGYWDRVEDRLFKIRNCMNIKGVRRQLLLFQPPIDPGMLVKAKAAGLGLEDIISTLYGELPPYRFIYLIEKAKSFTATIQGFGSALLSALEKKDIEELTLLRSVHEQNILKLTKDIKKKQIEEAKEQLESLKASKVNIENRMKYYDDLISEGLIKPENVQQVSRHTATSIKTITSSVFSSSSIFYMLPQLGSPFAMKWGGKEQGDSLTAWGNFFSSLASISESIAASAGLEAGFERRSQDWRFQLKLSTQELEQIQKQIIAAEIRIEIAEKDYEINTKNIEQSKELYDFNKDKFTKLGLYNWMASTLNKLYRQAYNMALDMAKLTERAYQFERDDDTIFIQNDNWDAQRAGLLAGERLMLQLQQMEKAYIEKNVRDYEVNQSFSIAQIHPEKLIELRENGSCEFEIPEIFFDLFYPGQYKRMIKSVRLTLPCVTGPYANVSCKLTLTDSKIRKEPKLDADLINVPHQKSTSVATSNANNDGGTFELNFRDERYMPFEGAGAISTWNLELPDKLRQFDYDTISDVIMHISYTAKDDGAFREKVETEIENSLIEYAESNDLMRLFSMKREFSNNLHKFLHPLAANGGYETTLNITMKHFPYFLHDKTIVVQEQEIEVFLKLKDELQLQPVEFSITGNVDHGEWVLSSGDVELIPENIEDIFILFKYTMFK
ncbi:MAG: neuraminidase-like domain-containing protein [Bacteroidota bacterium]